MENVQPEEGWFYYAHRLDAAISCADFTKAARMVLREIIVQLFGPAKLKSAHVSPSAMGKRFGRPKQYFARGTTELLRSHVIGRVSGGRLRIRKDYTSWTLRDGKTPRFTDRELEEIKTAVKHAWTFVPEGDRPKVRTATKGKQSSVINPVDRESTKVMTHQPSSVISPVDRTDVVVNSIDDEKSTGLMTISSGAHREARAELELETLRETNKPPTPFEGENGTRVGGAPLSGKETSSPRRPSDFDSLCRRADRMLPSNPLGRLLSAAWYEDPRLPVWWEEFSSAVWKSALDACAKPRPGNGPMTLNYFLAVVERKGGEARIASSVKAVPPSQTVPVEYFKAPPGYVEGIPAASLSRRKGKP